MKANRYYPTLTPLLLLVIPVICLFFSICFLSCNLNEDHTDAFYEDYVKKSTRELTLSPSRRAIEQVDSVLAHAKGLHPAARIAAYDLKSRYYYEKFILDTASQYIDSLILFLEKNDLVARYPFVHQNALNARGDYYFNENNFDKAFEYYYKSRAEGMTQKIELCVLGNYSYHLGMITYRQEKYKESAEYFKESFYEIGHCSYDSNTYYRQQEVLSNAGLAYNKLNMTDSAIQYFRKALAFIDTVGSKYNYSARFKRLSETAAGVALGNLSKAYIALGQNDTAEQLLLKSIAINTRPGYENYDAEFTNMQLAELYFNTGKSAMLLPVMNNLRRALDTQSNAAVNLRWHHLMYKYQKQLNRQVDALTYLEGYTKLKDSSEATAQRLKKTDYGRMLKDQETQFQIKYLKKDNQLNKLYLIVTVTLSVIAILVIGLVYYNYTRSRKNVEMLTSLNIQVNEQKERLEEAMTQLKISNSDKDRILRIVAHDLRTPINGVMMISEFMLEEETNKEKIESLKMMMTAAKNLIHLTNELLEFSGNEKQADIGEKELTDLNEVAKQTIGILQFRANEKKQKIELTLAPEQLEVLAFKEKISRVLSNLVGNAVKFSNEGAVIKVVLAKDKDKVLIKVIDNGIGIPAKYLPFLFDSFTGAKRHGTAGETSYGLGLSICKQIIAIHNGRIWVESTEGIGTTFFIELPA